MLPPPDSTTIETDPNIIEGPQKRHPSQHDLENGDPPAMKKTKLSKARGSDKSTKATTVAQCTAVGNEDEPHPRPSPHCHDFDENDPWLSGYDYAGRDGELVMDY
jgi:hypothetical protein